MTKLTALPFLTTNPGDATGNVYKLYELDTLAVLTVVNSKQCFTFRNCRQHFDVVKCRKGR